ncbi:MAG: beta-N-acetylhexosaminidase [Betaproteobacteria bacterium]|nr:beta-N-acetylhexosaminidase [Betaproteobacteria bacterium]
MPLGPVMLDVAGTSLTPEEREVLTHPATGGVILFARNFADPEQLAELVGSIHALRTPPLLVAVDQEGGRVQRFRDGFTRLPPMADLGRLWNESPERARRMAAHVGEILALELRAHGVDFSFAPVLDLDHGRSAVVGDRAFHRDPHAVAMLAASLVAGLAQGGMGAVGKHFPGHGYAEADSHVAAPSDPRALSAIERDDLVPFRHLVSNGLTGIMPAHVVYPAVDDRPAGFSPRWLRDILRHDMHFQGVVFSDDLSMVGAHAAGSVLDRAHAALDAGCDMVLVCNDSPNARLVVERIERRSSAVSLAALARLHGRPRPAGFAALRESAEYASALAAVSHWRAPSGDLPLA